MTKTYKKTFRLIDNLRNVNLNYKTIVYKISGKPHKKLSRVIIVSWEDKN